MRVNPFICAAIVAMMVPAVALADDPRDPAMRNAAARARDANATRQLNLAESAMVQQRDAPGRHVVRADGSYEVAPSDYAASMRDHQRAMSDYTRSRAQYERQMAAWRHAVAACQAGDYSACDN